MSGLIRCNHCGHSVRPNPRLREQRYCGDKRCQRVRKTLWQRQKMATDADYQANQRESQRRWLMRNRDYWRRYRSRHPGACERNCLLQRFRNRKRRLLKGIAKMDALAQKILLIPAA